MVAQPARPQALQASALQYLKLLDEGIEHERKNDLHSGFAQARIDYESFLTALDNAQRNTLDLSSDSELTNRFNQLRNGLIAEHRQALDNIYNAQAAARDRATNTSCIDRTCIYMMSNLQANSAGWRAKPGWHIHHGGWRSFPERYP